MCIAWLAEIKRGPSGLPLTKGAPDGPRAPYPTLRPNERGDHHPPLLIDDACPHLNPRPMLRVSQETLGLGGHRAGPLRAVARHRKRALVPSRCRTILLAPVPRSCGTPPFLVPPKGEKA